MISKMELKVINWNMEKLDHIVLKDETFYILRIYFPSKLNNYLTFILKFKFL